VLLVTAEAGGRIGGTPEASNTNLRTLHHDGLTNGYQHRWGGHCAPLMKVELPDRNQLQILPGANTRHGHFSQQALHQSCKFRFGAAHLAASCLAGVGLCGSESSSSRSHSLMAFDTALGVSFFPSWALYSR
jgi:hypothetical protein